jgi:hypothetical protein
LQKKVSKYIKENFYDKMISLIENKEYSGYVNNFYDSGVLKNENTINRIDFGQVTFDFTQTIGLRSYKNFQDFINYYKSTVEGLAKEAVDRV